MKELTKEQKLYVINEMIRYYKKTKVEGASLEFMCNLLKKIIAYDLGVNRYSGFPEFFDNKPNTHKFIWFPFGEAVPRLKYCLKIKKLLCKK